MYPGALLKALKVLLALVMYVFDMVTDVRVLRGLCCHNIGDHWTQIVNPTYCSVSFLFIYGSSIICNAVAFRQFLGEFHNPLLRVLFACLGVMQVLPFTWLIYCIVSLLIALTPARVNDLYMGCATVKMFEAIFEGAGQMCLQMYLVMEDEQQKVNPPVGTDSFTKCLAPNVTVVQDPAASATSGIQSHVPQAIVDHRIYLSLVISLLGVSYTIVKWVFMQMKKTILYRLGYVALCLLTVGSRIYLKSTLGTYWDTDRFFFNVYWFMPLFACNISQLIYTCIAPGPKITVQKFMKRWISGTCDFLSKDGLPTSCSYFICSLCFVFFMWTSPPNIHLSISLGLNTFVMLVNIGFSFVIKEPIFKEFFDKDHEGIYATY